MDKDRFTKKLESLDIPDILIEGHRRKLREALLSAAAVKGLRREETFLDSLDLQFDSFFRLWQRPAWKFAFSSLIVVGIMLSLTFGFRLSGDVSPTVLASNIALASPELPGLLEGNGEIRVLKVDLADQTARVICGRDIGTVVQADIDLKERRIIRTQRLEGLFMAELTENMKTQAITIASTDPRVKQILSQGARCRKVLPSFSSLLGVSKLDENTLKLVPSTDAAVVQIELNGRSWLIQTNLQDGMVERIIEPQRRTPAVIGIKSPF